MAEAAGRTSRAYGALDGIRALAATSVFVYHFGLRTFAVRSGNLSWIVLLDVGVQIFFVVSGFLIYRPFAARHIGDQPSPDLGGYARRRLLRIFPAYLTALVVLRLLGQIGMNGAPGYLKHLTLTQTYFADRGGLGLKVSWTLVIELSFYAFVPVWAFIMRGVARRNHALSFELGGTLVLIGVGYLFTRWKYIGHLPPWATVLPPALAALGLGMLLAIVSLAPRESRIAAVGRGLGHVPAGIWWAAGVAMFVALAQLPIGYFACESCRAPLDFSYVNWVQPLIAACIVIPAVFGDPSRGLVRRALQLKPVAYVGMVSYGVYLWHVFVIDLLPSRVFRDPSRILALAAFAAALLVTVAIASVSYFVIERPVMHLARRRLSVGRGRSTPSSPSGA